MWRRRLIALVALVALSLGGKALLDTTATPVIERASFEMTGLPRELGPMRIALLADIHVAGPDMPPSRLAKIVDQVNALDPDIVLFAGDFVSDKRTATRHYSAREALAPLAALDPQAIKIAVPGNHDHWRDLDAIADELSRHRIVLLRNEVSNVGGLLIAGLDDDFTGRARLDEVVAALSRFNRKALFLSHSPDPFADLPPNSGIMLAGHTHCGQIGYPWGGSPATMSDYGERYACGIVRENGNILVTSAGLGTSVLPFRLFTKPEIWVVELQSAGAN